MGIKVLLISLPWADYQTPSLQIGLLGAYARERGFDVEARHLHLDFAANYDFRDYDDIILRNNYLTEPPFFAELLFPEKRGIILKHLKKYVENPVQSTRHISRAIHKLYRDIDWNKYAIVGFTINSNQLYSSLLIAKWLKDDFPHIKVLFGGACVAGEVGASVLRCFPQVDWCVDGEGETAFTTLLNCLSKGVEDIGNYVPGLIYRKNNVVAINPRQQLSRLDNLPDPDYDHYFHLLNIHPKLRNEEIMPLLIVESSRGCPHRCAFCSVHHYEEGYRVRPPHEVAEQIERLSERYRSNQFRFVDNMILPKYGEQLFSLIERQHCDYYIFDCQFRATTNKKQLNVMKRAGVRGVQIGVEAFSTNLLNKMNKGTRVIDNLQAMKMCEEFGIENVSFFLLGFPTESQRDINESVRNIEYASAYCPPAFISPFRLEVGAPIYMQFEKYGISNIRNPEIFRSSLPFNIADKLLFTVKEFSSNRKPRNYKTLKKRYARWKREYNEARRNNDLLLIYYDCEEFLRIEDYRYGAKTITLSDNARKLYLVCNSYKSFDEIKKRFPKWHPREIKKVLNKLVKLKVMFREDDDYLSLAIRANGPK